MSAQLPLFPGHLSTASPLRRLPDGPVAPITWDSELPSDASQYQQMDYRLHPHATVSVRYQLHAYNKRQRIEQEHSAPCAPPWLTRPGCNRLGAVWAFLLQHRARDQGATTRPAREQVDNAERMLLREERRHAETERQLLEQRLATQNAEQHALEMPLPALRQRRIMAGSYAHNIKNLLVRPNDLLRRCLDERMACRKTRRRCFTKSAKRSAPSQNDCSRSCARATRSQPFRTDAPRFERSRPRHGTHLERPGA